MTQGDIRLLTAMKLFDVPDESFREELHGVLSDCLTRLLPPLFVSGNSEGHAFNVRTQTGLGIQVRLPARTPSEAVLLFGWNGDTPPVEFQEVIARVIQEIRITLEKGPVDFLVSAMIDIGSNRILGRHQLSDGISIAGALKTHQIQLATVHEHKKTALTRLSQEFQGIFSVKAISQAAARLKVSRPAAELALFLTVLLRYPIYRGQITVAASNDIAEPFPNGYDLRDGQEFETEIVRPDLTDHDSLWMSDQYIYPDPTPYPGDAKVLFRQLSDLPDEKKHRFFAAAHAYRLALRLLTREFLRGFLPEQSYSIAIFQSALEALAHPDGRDRLLSAIRKRTPKIYGHYRGSPLSDPDRARNRTIHEGQLFGGEMEADPEAQMTAGLPIGSDRFFRMEAAKAETTAAAIIIDWLSHGGVY